MRRAIFIVAAVMFAAACSSHAPEIMQTDAALVFDRTPEGAVTQSVRLFVDVFDADGRADLALLRLRHAESETEWLLQPEEWTVVESSGEFWVGASRWSPGGATVPRGNYTITVEDLAGRRAETSFVLPARPATAQISRFPRFEVDAQGLPVAVGGTASDRVALVRVDGGDAAVAQWLRVGPLDNGARQTLSGGGAGWYLYHEIDGVGYASGPWVFER